MKLVLGEMMQELLVTADDRTGALEIGGVIAGPDFSIPVGPEAKSDICCVVDTCTRHLPPEDAKRITYEKHLLEARFHCHKMDSGLRGNWPHEIEALNELGYSVALVPSYPDAGRRCDGGTVYIQDVPVLQSPFGQDPLTAPCSSRPDEVMEEAGCSLKDTVIWDANDNTELKKAISRCREENRVLVGPTGAIGSYAETIFPDLKTQVQQIETPVLIVCGSLNSLSRKQISNLTCPVFGVSDILDVEEVAILETSFRSGPVSSVEAAETAQAIAKKVRGVQYQTLFVIGGDTAGAIVGNRTLEVLGTVDTGIPIAKLDDYYLVTKGGGIGDENTLVKLLGDIK